MFDIQLGQRNLSLIQKIEIYEKRRKFYDEMAKKKQIEAGEKYGIGMKKVTPNLGEAIPQNNRTDNETNSKFPKVVNLN